MVQDGVVFVCLQLMIMDQDDIDRSWEIVTAGRMKEAEGGGKCEL